MNSTVTGKNNISSFGGLNVNNTAGGNEFMDMNNLDTHKYPYLTTRRKNYLFPKTGLNETSPATATTQIVGQVAYDTDIYLIKRYGVSPYYDYIKLEKIDKNGNKTTCINSTQYFEYSLIASDYTYPREFTAVKRQLVIMGANIVIYPDWIEYNVKDNTFKSLGKKFTMKNAYQTVKFVMCDEEGNFYAKTSTIQSTSPNYIEDTSKLGVIKPLTNTTADIDATKNFCKENDYFYFDGENVSRYYHTSSMWMNVDYYLGIAIDVTSFSTTITETILKNMGLELNKDMDYVLNISGITDNDFTDLNGEQTIHRINLIDETLTNSGTSVTTKYLVFVIKGINKWTKTYANAQYMTNEQFIVQENGKKANQNIVIEAPLYNNLDFIVSEGNRLFACSSENHEIYASKLGDAGIWKQFQGISTDSYAATVGSPGDFTGATVFNNVPMFFKENCIHKVNGNTPSSFNISYDYYDGIKKGCDKSIVRVGNYLIFYSKEGFVYYTGSQPEKIDAELGNLVFKNVIAGAKERHYIAHVYEIGNEKNYLLDFDTEKGTWHKNDLTLTGSAFTDFISVSNDLYMVSDYVDDVLYLVGYGRNLNESTSTTEEGDLNYSAESGIIGLTSNNFKYVSKLLFKAHLDFNADIHIYLQYDFNEEWELVYSASNTDDKPRLYSIPIIPKRHEHLRYKIEGTGNIILYGIEYSLSEGSELR